MLLEGHLLAEFSLKLLQHTYLNVSSNPEVMVQVHLIEVEAKTL